MFVLEREPTLHMNPKTIALLGALTLAGCAGDLDDPDAFAEQLPIRAIRSANVYPEGTGPAAPAPAPPSGSTPPAVTQPVGAGGAPPTSAGCDRAINLLTGTTCSADPSCHGAPGSTAMHALPWVDLNFDVMNLASRLSTTKGTGTCSALNILDVANPMQSLLVTKLTDPPACGSPMPFNKDPISAEDKQCITDWVVAQAQALAP